MNRQCSAKIIILSSHLQILYPFSVKCKLFKLNLAPLSDVKIKKMPPFVLSKLGVQLGVLVPLCKALQLLFTFHKISNLTNLTLLRQPEMMSSYLVFSYGLQPQIPPSLHRNKMHAKHVHMHYACMKTSSGAPASHMVLHCSCYVQNKASKARYLFGRADGVKHD